MKITFLGTNGWYDTGLANTTCIFVETDEDYIILDAGGGFYKVRELIKKDKPVHLFISHLHLDHIIGLHTLPLFKVAGGIDVYMPKGMKPHLETFLNKPYTSAPDTLATKLRLHEIDTERPAKLKCEFATLLHSPVCYGFRFTLEGKTLAYCTDTGACEGLRTLAKGCDLLITECAWLSGEDVGKSAHLNPEVAATIAKESGTKRLALMHFDASRYHSLEDRDKAEKSSKKIFPDTFASADGQETTI